ncbi:OTU domain-containing protein 4 isoform X3 [Pelobates fuscus]|uniref:OTU domain-containing protein 4 isoform X3 n=1 Tax=Pelobates fuscus TaxID=191477 RepID=UPI002FE4C868
MDGHGTEGTAHGASSKEEEAMDLYLRSQGLFRKKIAKDGSCLFRAVAEQVLHSQTQHLEIRKSCIDYLRENRGQFEAFIEGSFEDYLKSLENPQEWVGQVEISALSLMFKRDFVIYQEPNFPPSYVTGNGFSEKILLCFSNGNHYDIIYPLDFIENAALCQSLVYELLYEKVLDVNIGEGVLKPDTSSLTADDACRSDASGSDMENEIAGGEKVTFGDMNGFKAHKDSKNGMATLSQTVLRSLDPSFYRNVEYDVWFKSQRDQQKLDFSIAAGMQYSVGDKCLVRLESGGKFYGAHIQEVAVDNGPIVVFIEELAKKQAVPLKNLKPISLTISSSSTDGWNTVSGKKVKRSPASGAGMPLVKDHRGQKGLNRPIKPQTASSSRLQQSAGNKLHGPSSQSSDQVAQPENKGRSRTPPKVPVSRKLERSDDSSYFKRENVYFGLTPEERREKQAFEESKSLYEIQSMDEDAFPALSTTSSVDQVSIQSSEVLTSKKGSNVNTEKRMPKKPEREDQSEKASKSAQAEKVIDQKAAEEVVETPVTSDNDLVLPSPSEQPTSTTVPSAAPTETTWSGIPAQIPASPGIGATVLQSQVTAAPFTQLPVSVPAVNQPMLPIPQPLSAYQDPLYPGFPLNEQNESAALPPYSFSKVGEDLPTDKSILRFFFNLGVKAYTYHMLPPVSYLNPLRQASMCRMYPNFHLYPQGHWVPQEASVNQSLVDPSIFAHCSEVQPESGSVVSSPTLEASFVQASGIEEQVGVQSGLEAKDQNECQGADFSSVASKSMIPHTGFGHGPYMGHLPIAPTFVPHFWYSYPYQPYIENPVIRQNVFIPPQMRQMPENIALGEVLENNLTEATKKQSLESESPPKPDGPQLAGAINCPSGSNFSSVKVEELRKVTPSPVEYQESPGKAKDNKVTGPGIITNVRQVPVGQQGLQAKPKDNQAAVSSVTSSATQTRLVQQDLPGKTTDKEAALPVLPQTVTDEVGHNVPNHKVSVCQLVDAIGNVQTNAPEVRPARTREESSEDEREVSNMLNSGRAKNFYNQTYGTRRPRNEKYYPPGRGYHSRNEEGWRAPRGREEGYQHQRNFRGRPYRRRAMGDSYKTQYD